ncbi:MAG: hypothetical protein ACPGF7_09365 [Pontibacterium sp.]
MNYDDMTNFELSVEIIKNKHPDKDFSVYDFIKPVSSESDSLAVARRKKPVVIFTCFDVSCIKDMWPIICEERIDIRFDWDNLGTVTATVCGHANYDAEDEDPLRAAAICYLEFKEGEE